MCIRDRIYSIHADFVSTDEETNVNPIVFALLPNKKKETYIRLFQLIRKTVPEWNPETVNVDFEMVAVCYSRSTAFSTYKRMLFSYEKNAFGAKYKN